MGKLIAIEAIDGAGKELQSNLLENYLKNNNKKVKKISFPNYTSKSSELVKMYLNGDFGKNSQDISPYIASVFFACDRYASYMTEWKNFYMDNDTIIICDRYVSSNIIHQSQKYDDLNEREDYINWLYNFEYNIMNLPKPDITIYLDIEFEISLNSIKNRKSNNKNIDIHENDILHLKKSYDICQFLKKSENWVSIKSSENKEFLDKNIIHNNVIKKLKEFNII